MSPASVGGGEAGGPSGGGRGFGACCRTRGASRPRGTAAEAAAGLRVRPQGCADICERAGAALHLPRAAGSGVNTYMDASVPASGGQLRAFVYFVYLIILFGVGVICVE